MLQKPLQATLGLLLYGGAWQFCLAHGMTEAEKQSIIEGGNLAYLQLGATHMLTGYDHLLFVFGIIFFLYTFRDIIKYVTAFTVGHSITLIIATFNGIQLNYFLIDAIVGLSVCYIAFANIDGFRRYLSINPPKMMAMILGLGLIHGFGLSSRLQELPLSEDNLLLNIISFNAGIELGQIFALLLMILLMDFWRKTKSFNQFSFITNYVLIIAGVLLFLMQMHGYTHYANAAEFNAVAVQTAEVNADVIVDQTDWQDVITVRVPAQSGIEYKFHAEEAAVFDYAWQTDGAAVYYDFHGEPDGDETDYFKSYEENTTSQATGSLTAPFKGIHGWYWHNHSSTPVIITLKAKGDYRRLDARITTSQPVPAEPSTASVDMTGWEDLITVSVPARGDKEYKFHLEEGATFEYTWQAAGAELYYDFHGEPEGDTTGYFKSFEENTARQASGSLTASFKGVHGWYWQNKTDLPVDVTLRAKGDYRRLDAPDTSSQSGPNSVPVPEGE